MPDPLPCTVAELGTSLLGLLDHLQIDRCELVGLSLGGMVAMWLACHFRREQAAEPPVVVRR